jgi:hypothetical protein
MEATARAGKDIYPARFTHKEHQNSMHLSMPADRY